jgi:transposase
VAHLAEIGSPKRGEAATLAGVAAYVRDSVTSNGRPTSIDGDRAPVSKAAYMAARLAIRHNPVCAKGYASLSSRGKPFKVAMTAIMRKILEIINQMCKHNTPWKIA